MKRWAVCTYCGGDFRTRGQGKVCPECWTQLLALRRQNIQEEKEYGRRRWTPRHYCGMDQIRSLLNAIQNNAL